MSSYYEKFLATGEVKCIDEEIPFEIPATWEWARFSTIVNMSPTVSAEDDVDVAFMPMALINAGYGSEYSYETKKWSLIKTGFTKMAVGDIAFAKITPCFQNRKSFILEDVPGKVAAATTELNVLRLYGQTLYAWYVLYFLKSDYFIKEAKYKGTAGQQRVLSSYIQNKLFPIPPYNEQYRIIEKIQEVLPVVDKYEKSQKGLDKLNALIFDKLRKSILQEAIQGKLVPQITEEGTAQELFELIKAEKLKLVKEGKIKKTALTDSIIYKGDDNKYYEQIGKKLIDITEQIPFDIPDSWNWVRGRFIFLPMESIKPTSDFIYIDVDAVNNRTNVIDNPKTIRAGHAPSRATRKLHEYDVLFSMVRPYLKNIALVDSTYKEAIASTGFYVITPSIGLYPKFLFNLMLSSYIVDGLNTFIKGDNSPSINNCHIENFLYPLPPIKEQQRIVTQIEKLFEQLH